MQPFFEGWPKADRPRKKPEDKNRDEIPKRLAMLKYWSEVALEIVLKNENAEEVWVAQLEKQVPRQRAHAKYRYHNWMN